MNKRHYEHTLPNIRGSLSNTYFSHATVRKTAHTKKIILFFIFLHIFNRCSGCKDSEYGSSGSYDLNV